MFADIASKYPMAYPKLLADWKAQQLTQAQIDKERAVASKDTASANETKFKVIGNLAGDLANNPSVLSYQRLAKNAEFMGLPLPGAPSLSQNLTADDLKSYGSFLQSAAMDPKARAEIWKINTLTPADLAKTQTETGLMPYQAQTGRISANASASQAQTHRMDLVTPKIEVSEATGLPVSIDRFAPGGGAVNALANAPQMKPTVMQKDLASNTAKEVGALQTSAQAAMQGKQALDVMRGMDSQGIFSGGIQGSDTFKTLANVWAAAVPTSKDFADKLATTQAWDAKSGELVAMMVKQLGGNRVTNSELSFMKSIKPNTLQTEPGRQMLYNILDKSFANQIETANQAAAYVQKPGQYTLGGFTPSLGGSGNAVLRPNADGTMDYVPGR